MAQTPLSQASPGYLTVAGFLLRCDQRTVADLVSDDGTPVDTSTLASNEKLIAALVDASGLVEGSAMHGGRYTPSDLAALTGVAAGRLFRLITEIAVRYLYERRPDKGPAPEMSKLAEEDLKLLRSGESVFGTVETFAAQSMDHEVETARRVEDRNGVSFMARRLFGRRSNRADGSE